MVINHLLTGMILQVQGRLWHVPIARLVVPRLGIPTASLPLRTVWEATDWERTGGGMQLNQQQKTEGGQY